MHTYTCNQHIQPSELAISCPDTHWQHQNYPAPPPTSPSALIMALLHESQDGSELNHLWQLITELREQLNENRSLSVSLYTTAADIKVRMMLGREGRRN